MTTANRELFELCKQVYEATGWHGDGTWAKNKDEEWSIWNDVEMSEYSYPGFQSAHPAYTSDYLLEKLPSVVQDPYDKIFRHIQMWINGDRSAHAGYVEPYVYDDRVAYAQKSDEMRITLLKLTLKLHEDKIL